MSKAKGKRIIFAENLSYLMTQHNISAEALNKMLAAKFQWPDQSNSVNTIKGYAQGSQLPNSKRRQQIASMFGVTDAYMLTKHKNRVPLCDAPTDPMLQPTQRIFYNKIQKSISILFLMLRPTLPTILCPKKFHELPLNKSIPDLPKRERTWILSD